MDTIKDVVSLLSTIVGLLTALAAFTAHFRDKKDRADKQDAVEADPPRPAGARQATDCPSCGAHLRFREDLAGECVKCPTCTQTVVLGAATVSPVSVAVEVEPKPRIVCQAVSTSTSVEQARNLVRAPAIGLLVAGFLGLAFNLLVAGYGYVNQFVTPLDSDSAQRRAAMQTWTPRAAAEAAERDRSTTLMTIFMVLSFSVACAVAIWAGFNMVRLRSYWLSLAGCFAVMPGACLCCLAGVPVGVWSLTVLLKPEVRSAFS